MTNTHNRRYEAFTTPIGLSGFASTQKESKFGGYTLDLFLENNKENQKFVSDLQQSHSLNIAHETDVNGSSGTSSDLNFEMKDTDPTQFQDGDYLVVRMKRKGTPPNIHDASGSLTSLSHEIPIGSEVRIALTCGSYSYMGRTGSTLYLNDIQIVNLAKRSEKSLGTVFDATDGEFIGVGTLDDSLGLD